MFCLFIEIYWSIVEASLKYYGRVIIVILKKYQELLFLQYVFNLISGKMANTIAHQRTILKGEKTVEVLS
jgi:hypothetical protein